MDETSCIVFLCRSEKKVQLDFLLLVWCTSGKLSNGVPGIMYAVWLISLIRDFSSFLAQWMGSLVEHDIVLEGERGFKRHGTSGKKVTRS